MTRRPARLALADGTTFEGFAFGADGARVGELVFTTGMTGYQEVLTDPSYAGQLVTMTAPHIGNTGTTPVDDEAEHPRLAGFIVHEPSWHSAHWRSDATLDAYLQRHHVVALGGVDTRTLTRHIRDHGAQMGAVGTLSRDELVDRARAAPPMSGRDLASEVSTREPYEWSRGFDGFEPQPSAEPTLHVVAYDFGIKRGILRHLVHRGCRVTVVPASMSADAVLALTPDGIFLSNGPGDPAATTCGVTNVRALLGKRPMFGICLGHQLLALALGASTYKLKFGHRGLNQPVKDLTTGRVEITTQNHGFAVDVESLKGRAELTHVHLNDGSCEGVAHAEARAFAVQYHPEAQAGTHDAEHLFDRFVASMRAAQR